MLCPAAQRLNQRVGELIPVAARMGLTITAYDGRRLSMDAPLAPNRNDKGTAFAGSIAGLATFAGWALITLKVEERQGAASVAVYRSEISYRLPIDGDFQAFCELPDEDRLADFWYALQSTGRGRLDLAVSVMQGGEERVRFQGAYAVRLTPPES